jgi:hypothetical protein
MPNPNDYLHKLTHLKRGIAKYGSAPQTHFAATEIINCATEINLLRQKIKNMSHNRKLRQF